jgi:hypothetical protein
LLPFFFVSLKKRHMIFYIYLKILIILMASYNYNNEREGQGMGFVNSAVENKGLFSRILRTLSNYGMNYDDMIVRNQVGIGINEDPTLPKETLCMISFLRERSLLY